MTIGIVMKEQEDGGASNAKVVICMTIGIVIKKEEDGCEGKAKVATPARPRTPPAPTPKTESQPVPAAEPSTPSALKLDASTEPAAGGSVFESPWLWTGVGATLVAGVITWALA